MPVEVFDSFTHKLLADIAFSCSKIENAFEISIILDKLKNRVDAHLGLSQGFLRIMYLLECVFWEHRGHWIRSFLNVSVNIDHAAHGHLKEDFGRKMLTHASHCMVCVATGGHKQCAVY